MLTAYQIDALRDKATTLLDPVINFLIEDIAERVSEAGQLTGTAAYQVWRAQRLGMSQKKLKKEIAKRLKIPLAQVEQLMRQAAKTGYNFDLSRLPNKRGTLFEANSEVQQIVDAAVAQAQQNLTNIVQTMGFVNGAGQAQPLTRAYQQACDQAFMKSVTGATDYISAVRNATRGLAAQGIVSIDYASGVHTSIEAAVRRNIMGGLGLMQEQISEHNHDALGCNGWEIDAHEGSAPDHEPFQGRQYDDKTYKNLNNSLLRRIGTLNCGHDVSGIILGVNEPQYTEEQLEAMRRRNAEGVTIDGKHYTLYEATQRQRNIERRIRKRKRNILIDEKLGDKGKLETDQIRLTLLRQEYARFSKAAGLRTQHERAEVAGFTWKHGKAAEETASNQSAKSGHNGSPVKSKSPSTGAVTKKHSNGSITEAPKRGSTEERAEHEAVKDSKAVEWDDKRGVRSWSEDQIKRLISAEYASVREPVENGILYGANGKRIFRKKGDSSSVEFTSAEIKQMRDGVLTHNHPGANYGCFSPADINMLREGHLSEIRVATPIGVFSMQRPTRWPTGINGLEKIREVYYDIDNTIGSEYWARAYRGEMSLLDADNLGQRAVVEELCKRYRIPFRFDSWDDLGRESYESLL